MLITSTCKCRLNLSCPWLLLDLSPTSSSIQQLPSAASSRGNFCFHFSFFLFSFFIAFTWLYIVSFFELICNQCDPAVHCLHNDVLAGLLSLDRTGVAADLVCLRLIILISDDGGGFRNGNSSYPIPASEPPAAAATTAWKSSIPGLAGRLYSRFLRSK